MNGQQQAPVQNPIIIEKSITEDPSVVSSLVFYVYTGLILDVSKLTGGTCDAQTLLLLENQQDVISDPSISFNLLELYRLAHYLEMEGLMDKLQSNFLQPMEGCDFDCCEEALGCLLVQCRMGVESGEDKLFMSAANAYVRLTRGLGCLCKWPLLFEREKWDRMMHIAKDFTHHWFAHVVPLYVMLFFPAIEDDAEALKVGLFDASFW